MARATRSSTPERRGAALYARGMTLLEVLIVVALIALMMATLVLGSGMLSSSRQHAAASAVVSLVRLAITRANGSGNSVRIVFDLDQDRLFLEESASRMLRDDSVEEDPAAGAQAATDVEAEAQKEAERILDGPSAPRPEFRPSPALPAEGRELGPGIEFRQVQTQHDDEPVTEGRAYLYFWPGGETERASIQIRRQGTSDEEQTLTVSVSALTGRARIQHGRVDLPETRNDEGEFTEREEEF